MSRTRYPMQQVYEDVEFCFSSGIRPSDADIRCMINNHLDMREKDGFIVNHRYSQTRACAEVRRMHNATLKRW